MSGCSSTGFGLSIVLVERSVSVFVVFWFDRILRLFDSKERDVISGR
jgi:hypothetical protein